MTNPYAKFPSTAFWRTAVADPLPEEITGLWSPKFNIQPDHKVATYGSCFAQHIGQALVRRNYHWLCTEKAPDAVSDKLKKRFGYEVFSSRTANIYTTTLLLQWARWSLEGQPVPDEVWERDDRFVDPFRPNIEPHGFASEDELLAMRRVVLDAFAQSVKDADVFVFTLGLTERWINQTAGYEYPMCPGTIAGAFDDQKHHFENLEYSGVKDALLEAMSIFKAANPDLRFVLTVSPVPLTATASGQHVLTATTYSKSVLRAVAGDLAAAREDVDYFPSYEIITSPVFQGQFFEENKRSVKKSGVDFVMTSFFGDLARKFGTRSSNPAEDAAERPSGSPHSARQDEDVVCEEVFLEAFGPEKNV